MWYQILVNGTEWGTCLEFPNDETVIAARLDAGEGGLVEILEIHQKKVIYT